MMHEPAPSARLQFRCWTERDLPFALQLWGDSQVTRFISSKQRLSPEEASQRLHRELETQAEHQISYWPVFQASADLFLGCCGLRPYGEDPQVREFGIQLIPQAWGRGYAQEASQSVFIYAFEQLGLRSLFAGHHPENSASEKLLRRLGFRRTHEELFEPTGRLHACYTLERQGWLADR